MSTLLLGLRTLLFALSILGYLAFLHKHTQVKLEFLPAVTFAGQICILFLGGILNILSLTVTGLLATGLAFLLLSIKSHFDFRKFLCPAYVFFAVSCLYFLFLLKGQVFNSYDNFSRWALLIKQMLLTNRFQSFQGSIILFQAYPLGSSVFVYFVSKIISPVSEGCQMFAQTMLSLSMILPLFSCAKKQKALNVLLSTGASIFLLSYNITPGELLVDTLLPLTGAAGFLLLEDELSEEKKLTWLSVPLAASAILIKNSGIFFWALMAGRILLYWIQNNKKASYSEKLSWIGLLLLPLFTLLLWKKHVEYVFASSMDSPHSMSLQAYAANIQEKYGEAMAQIVQAFAGKVFSERSLLYLLVILLFAAIASFIWKQRLMPWVKTALLILCVYAVYQLGNLCMYIFSMPMGEAVVMAGYDRYYRTIIIWCFVYTMYQLFLWLDAQRSITAGSLVFVLFICFYLMGGSPAILKRTPKGSTRAQLEQIMETYPMLSSPACLIYIPQDDSGYTYHLTKYLLYTPTVDVHITSDQEELAASIHTAIELGYDYFINLDQENEMIRSYCQEAYGLSGDVPFMELR